MDPVPGSIDRSFRREAWTMVLAVAIVVATFVTTLAISPGLLFGVLPYFLAIGLASFGPPKATFSMAGVVSLLALVGAFSTKNAAAPTPIVELSLAVACFWGTAYIACCSRSASARRIGSMEQELESSERRLESALRTVDGHWSRDLQDGRTHWSDGFYRFFGREPKSIQIDVTTLRSLVHREDWPGLESVLLGDLDEDGTGRATFRALQLDGSYRWALATTGLISDADGRPFRLFGTVIDIDARKRAEEDKARAEEDARTSRQQLLHAIDSLNEGFALYDAADRLILCNQHFREMYYVGQNILVPGVSFEEHLRLCLAEGVIVEESGHREEWISERLKEHREPTGPSIEMMSDGRSVRVSEHKTPDGGIVAIQTDITALRAAEIERVASEQRIRGILEAISDGYFDRDLKTGIDYWSDGIYRLLGISPEDVEPSIETFLDMVHPDDRPGASAVIERYFDYGLAFRVEARLCTAGGEYRWIAGRGRTLKDANGKPYRMIGAVVDIHEAKITEHLRNQHKADAERLHRHLMNAIESMEDGFALYDEDKRLVLCNSKFREIYSIADDFNSINETFGQPFRTGIDSALEAEAANDQPIHAGTDGALEAEAVDREIPPATHLAEAQTATPSGFIRQFSDGRWLKISNRQTSDGGVVALRTDITRLKRTEERLAASELRFRDFANATSDWFWETDRRHRYTYISERTSVQTDAGLADRHQSNGFAIAPATEGQVVLEPILSALERNEPFRDIRYGWRLPDGETRYVSSSAKPIFDENGRFVGFRGVGTDVTDVVRGERLRRSAERVLSQAIEALPVLFALFDEDDNIVVENRRFREIFEKGYRDPERESVDFEQSIRHFAEKHLEGSPQERSEWIDTRMQRRTCPASGLELRHDGDYWLSLSDYLMPDGKVITLGVDLTAIKRAEATSQLSRQRLKTIFDSAPDAIISVDDAGIVEAFSKSAEKTFDISEEAAIGTDVGDLLNSGEIALSSFADWAKANIGSSNYEVEGRRGDGSLFPALLSLSEMPGGPGQGHTLFLRDVTDLKSRDEVLRQAQKMETVGQLTGGIAHDFNNLLTAILGNVEILEMRVGDERDKEDMLRETREAALLGADLVNRLLSFARRHPMSLERIDVAELLRDLLRLVDRTLGAMYELALELEDDLPDIYADASQLRNSVLNLAINARDAMPKGGAMSISASARTLSEAQARHHGVNPGRYAVIRVCDHGSGIPKELRDRVYEPFFTTKEAGRGTGLGLSMVYGFAQQSSGFTTLESHDGHGTCVEIALPEAIGKENDQTDAIAIRKSRIQGEGRTALVVEDDAMVRRVASGHMASLGFDVIEAADAREALTMIDDLPEGSLVFSDIIMPGGMTGLDLVAQLQPRRPDLAIILTTGFVEEEAVRSTTLPLLRKPYTLDQLTTIISNTL